MLSTFQDSWSSLDPGQEEHCPHLCPQEGGPATSQRGQQAGMREPVSSSRSGLCSGRHPPSASPSLPSQDASRPRGAARREAKRCGHRAPGVMEDVWPGSDCHCAVDAAPEPGCWVFTTPSLHGGLRKGSNYLDMLEALSTLNLIRHWPSHPSGTCYLSQEPGQKLGWRFTCVS